VALADGGVPVADAPLEVWLEGARVRRLRTDASGAAQARLSDLRVGEHEVWVRFVGTPGHAPARVAATVAVRPARVTVQVVPALAGVPFTLDDRRFVSGPDGRATVEVSEPGAHALAVLLSDRTQLTPDTRASFTRWGDAVFFPEREVDVGADVELEVGLELFQRVEQRFQNLDGDPVEDAKVEALTLKSSNGVVRTFADGSQRWLQVNRIQRRRTGLEPTPLQYAVEAVTMHGENVVNRYQQRFYVSPDDVWTVELLLYTARLRAADYLFGRSVGTAVRVVYPDGTEAELRFGGDGSATSEPLARGAYRVQVLGVAGVAPLTPLALSRDQDVVLKVLTRTDILVLGGVGVGLALGLLLIGRVWPWWRKRSARRRAERALTTRGGTPRGGTARGETVRGETARAQAPSAATMWAESPHSQTPRADTPRAETAHTEEAQAKTPRAETLRGERVKARVRPPRFVARVDHER